MMKYTPLTRVEKKPMTRAARPLAIAGKRSAPTGPGWEVRAMAAT